MLNPVDSSRVQPYDAGTRKALQPFWYGKVTLFFVLAAILTACCWTVYREQRDLSRMFLEETRVIARALDEQAILELTEGDANRSARGYQKLKTHLAGIHRATEHGHSIYLLQQRPDGSVTVLADSETPASPDYTPPGQRAPDIPAGIAQVFTEGRDIITGPYRNRQGRWISAVVPLNGSDGSRSPHAIMMDITTRDWYWDLARESAKSLSLFLLFLMPLAVYILQRRKTEQALVASDIEWHNTFDSMPDLIAVLDTGHRIVKANRAMREMMCRNGQGNIDPHCYRHFHGQDAPPEECPHSQLLKDGLPHGFEAYIPELQGTYAVTVTPLHDAKGTLAGSIHIAHDVSLQKRAEQALRKSEEQHRNLFEKSNDAIFLTIPNGAVLSANPAACRMFGMSEEEFIQEGRFSIIDTSDTRLRSALEIRSENGEFSGELNFVRKNGETFPSDVFSNIFTDSAGETRSMVRIRDISEHKHLEQKLQDSEERYRTLFNEVQIGIAMADAATGIIIDCNRWLAEISERPVEELVGSHQSILHPPKGDENHFSDSFDRHRRQVNGDLLLDHFITPSGELKDVEIKTRRFNYRGRDVVLGSFNDITLRKRVEAELHQKNAEIEQFIYTVSHDLRSPLVTVKTFLGYLEVDLRDGDSERTAKDLEFLHSAADRMEALLNELLDMSRIGRSTLPHEDVSYGELLAETLDSLAGQISSGAVAVQVNEHDFMLHGDRRRLLQIWQNLVDNAIKYIGEQVSPAIEIGIEHKVTETVFYVCDNGIGIVPDYHERIFGIFEQLDRERGGVGMGLTMVRRIVDLYGGRIWVESDGVGCGSCFRFTLPKALKDKGLAETTQFELTASCHAAPVGHISESGN